VRFPRLMAFAIDLAFAHFLYAFWSLLFVRGLLSHLPPDERWRLFEEGFRPLLSEPIFVFCYFWFLTALWSDTPGLAIMGLRVVRDTEQRKPLGFVWSFSRIFFLFLTLLPLGLGAIVSLFSPSGKTMYDCLSQSRVVGTADENLQIFQAGQGPPA
jgi:uncharacterized RDD family membrane protein YckC